MVSRLVIGILLLQLLNISVDAPDPFPEDVPEDLSYNEQESLVEIILEEVLDIENAIPEYDDYDGADDDLKTPPFKYTLGESLNSNDHSHEVELQTIGKSGNRGIPISGYLRIDTPPPII